jgi:hypothetical protein
MMTFGLAGMPHPSLAAMVDAVKAKMSREALHLRFTDKAVDFLHTCVHSLLQQKLQDAIQVDTKVLNRFHRIHIIDSSSWDLAAALKNVFPGCGGNASAAGCKIQLCYEYLRGTISFFEVGPGNHPDNAWSARLPELMHSGELLITDLGYFCLRTFHNIVKNGAFFISRFLIGTALLDRKTGKSFNLCERLRSLATDAVEMQVLMGTNEQTCIECRLVCLRVSEEVAKQRRDKLTKTIWKKKKQQPSAQSLYLCNWILMVTNVPADWLEAGMIRPFYCLRWQIELLFKQLKSVLAINKSNSAKESRVRCELLGRMIVAIVTHKIHAHINSHLWNTERKEISMDKFHKRFQERTFSIKDHLLASIKQAADFLTSELKALLKNCRKLNQKSRLTTLEYLHYTVPVPIPVFEVEGLT